MYKDAYCHYFNYFENNNPQLLIIIIYKYIYIYFITT